MASFGANFAAQVRLLDDKPISDPNRDMLGVTEHASLIAREIRGSNGPMIFGVFGEWGSGKTSFCQMVMNELNPKVKDSVTEDDTGESDGGASKPIVLSRHYKCSQYEQSGAPDLALMSAICSALHPNDADDATSAARRFLPQACSTEDENDAVRAVNAVARFEQMLSAELDGRRLVVMVDDLDRCKPDFCQGTLEALQRYHTCPGLFFVVAADRDIVLNAMAKRLAELDVSVDPPLTAEKALEKYFRWETRLPSLGEVARTEPEGLMLERIVGQLYEAHPAVVAEVPIVGLLLTPPTEYLSLIWNAMSTQGTIRGLKLLLNELLPRLAGLADEYSLGGDRSLDEVRNDTGFQAAAHRLVKVTTLERLLPGIRRLLRREPHRFAKLEALWVAMAREGKLFSLSDVEGILRTYTPELLERHGYANAAEREANDEA